MPAGSEAVALAGTALTRAALHGAMAWSPPVGSRRGTLLTARPGTLADAFRLG
ncbi:hypothetical protein ABTX99_18480 [Streptomyces flaveolus]|uniref:hypothetical protein n=1 Tax=Streptomyces flaveolus TaxID=67297 RepID=UPI003317C19D